MPSAARYRLLSTAPPLAPAVAGGASARGDTRMAAAAPPASLYDRLGGPPAIAAAVDDPVASVAANPRIDARCIGAASPRLKASLVRQIGEAAGEP